MVLQKSSRRLKRGPREITYGELPTLKGKLDKIKAEDAGIQRKLGKRVQAPTHKFPAGLPKKP
jgi:hypothetical protein